MVREKKAGQVSLWGLFTVLEGVDEMVREREGIGSSICGWTREM